MAAMFFLYVIMLSPFHYLRNIITHLRTS